MHSPGALSEGRLPRRRSVTMRLIMLVIVLYIAGSVLGGIGLGGTAMHPFRHPVTASEERNARAAGQEDRAEFRDVEVTALDGTVLSAWFMRPPETNGDAVILLHGVSDNRMGMYGYGKWLLQNHYMVLLPDARAHGNSGGELATYGLKEADDIHRWVDWIESAEHPRCMFGLGESMGAAQLLQALPKNLDFAPSSPNRRLLHFARWPTRALAGRFILDHGSAGRSFGQRSMPDFFMSACITA